MSLLGEISKIAKLCDIMQRPQKLLGKLAHVNDENYTEQRVFEEGVMHSSFGG